MTNVWSRLSSGVAGVSVCPPVALDAGVGLLCHLLELWGQVPAGVLTLTEWLLGEEEDGDEADGDKASGLVRIKYLKEQFTQDSVVVCIYDCTSC